MPSSSSFNIPAPLLVFAAIAGFMILMIVLAITGARKRRRALAEKIPALGFSPVIEPTKDQKDHAFARVRALDHHLRQGSRGVRWFASGPLIPHQRHGPEILLMEHAYSTGGKNNHTITHTLACVPVPAHFGPLALTHENLFHSIGKVFGLKDIDLENPAFNKAWRVKAADENFALAFLSQKLQNLLASPAPAVSHEQWDVTQGVMAVLVPRQLSPDALPHLLERLRAAIAALEPELQSQILAASSPGAQPTLQ